MRIHNPAPLKRIFESLADEFSRSSDFCSDICLAACGCRICFALCETSPSSSERVRGLRGLDPIPAMKAAMGLEQGSGCPKGFLLWVFLSRSHSIRPGRDTISSRSFIFADGAGVLLPVPVPKCRFTLDRRKAFQDRTRDRRSQSVGTSGLGLGNHCFYGCPLAGRPFLHLIDARPHAGLTVLRFGVMSGTFQAYFPCGTLSLETFWVAANRAIRHQSNQENQRG